MTWAQRLKRVFNIDIDKAAGQPICTAEGCREAVGHTDVLDETCRECADAVKVIAAIEAPTLSNKILNALDAKVAAAPLHRLPETRAPPQARLFD